MRVAVGGKRMYFDVDGLRLVPDGEVMAERPTILLLHGGPGMDHSAFKPEFGELVDSAQLICVDHSGQGRSDAAAPQRWTLDSWADDIIGFAMRWRSSGQSFRRLSFGGMVAMNLASRYPDRVGKLILQSTAARMDLNRIADAFRALAVDDAAVDDAAGDVAAGDGAADASRAFWATPTAESGARYMEVCLPLYSPEPVDPAGLARMVMTPALLEGGWESPPN